MVSTPAYDPPSAPSSDAAPAAAARHTGTIIAACLAVCLAQIGLVLPAAINGVMQRTLQTSGGELTWISDAFLVPAAVLALTFGVVGDLYGRKKLVVGAALLSAVGYLVSATSDSAAQLITGQAISGIGAAALFPASLSMIIAGTPTPAARAKGLASWTTALSLGALIAPLMSGGIVEHVSFQWAFGVTGVLAVITAVGAWLLATESSAPEGRSLDWPGQITIAVAMLTLLYGIIQGPSDGWGSAPVVASFVAFAVFIVAFVLLENRSAAPMLRLELFRIPAFAASAAMAVIGMFGFLGGAYDLSIRLGVIQHQSPFQAAVPFVIVQGITPFIWPLLVRLLHRVGPGPMLVTGFVSLAVAQLWLRAVPIDETGLVPLLGPLVLNGVGFGLVVAALTAAAVNVVPPTLTGMASATTSLVRDLGQTLGPAIVGAVALGMATSQLTGGLADAGLTPKEHGIASAVLHEGGPIALHTADLGPLSAKLAPYTTDALAHGYSNGLILTAAACTAAAVIAAVFVGFRPSSTRPAEAAGSPA
ncbi:MFS transporter [Streptomyces sp. SID12488]|uniref:MFS transporter n=1 Tax=Streptomyces sp. SID12488 TaxID=2706040 RepID=UPI0013DD3722|nr:MFS transporter [Streptomyces sp. SID12488]NEA61048.1 MFS transporter [Streptomyces sp. SID12488]